MARNKYPEETVQKILDVSQRLLFEKGYEATSIQSIINGLGGLSKGAIYHHFKSKEDILDAVAKRYNAQLIDVLRKISENKALSGLEQLRKMFELSLSNADKDIVYTIAPNMMENPKLLAAQLKQIFSVVVPEFIQPAVEQGVRDGSIKTEYPQELSEVIVMLTNLWLNPLILQGNVSAMERRVCFFIELLKNAGIELFDDKMLKEYHNFCVQAQNNLKKAVR